MSRDVDAIDAGRYFRAWVGHGQMGDEVNPSTFHPLISVIIQAILVSCVSCAVVYQAVPHVFRVPFAAARAAPARPARIGRPLLGRTAGDTRAGT